jgi:hypothetical protein
VPGEKRKTRLVDDALNEPLYDALLVEEADLVMHVMAVSNQHARPLTRGEIDAALGLPRRLRLVEGSPKARSST